MPRSQLTVRLGADLLVLERIMREVDPAFRSLPTAEFERLFDVLRAAAEADDTDAFLIAALHLTAAGGNAHTRLIPNRAIRVLPLRIVAIADGWRAFGAGAPPYGRRIATIGGRPVAQVFAALSHLVPPPDSRRRALSGLLLAWAPALALAGALDDGAAVYGFEDGATLRLPVEEAVAAVRFYPLPERGFPDPAIDPWSRGDLPGTSVYLRLATLDIGVDPDLGDRVDAALTALLEAPAADVVLDLRGNTGGSFFRAMPLVEALGARPSRCSILVDKFTFSAAIVTAALVVDRCGERAEVIGEAMGDLLSFWAEGGTELLPVTGAELRWSDGWHDWATGRPDATTPPDIAEVMTGVGAIAVRPPSGTMAGLFAAWR